MQKDLTIYLKRIHIKIIFLFSFILVILIDSFFYLINLLINMGVTIDLQYHENENCFWTNYNQRPL